MAALGRCTKDRHQTPPRATVWRSLASEQTEGRYMRSLVGDCSGQELAGMPFQDKRVVAYQAAAAFRDADLTGIAPPQIEPNPRSWELSAKVARRQVEKAQGKSLGFSLQVVA
jgi:hypothetical protein